MDPQKRRALLKDDVGFQEELIDRLERAELPPAEPQKLDALLSQLYPLFQQPDRRESGYRRRLLRCMLVELQSIPIVYMLAGLGVSALSILLAFLWQPVGEFSWAVLLPALPVAASLLFLFDRRYAGMEELCMTFLFDYRQLVLARTILVGAYSLLVDGAMLIAVGNWRMTDCLLFAISMMASSAAALRFIRHTNGVVGSVIILLCWTCGAYVTGLRSTRQILDQNPFLLVLALAVALGILIWCVCRFWKRLDKDLHTGRAYRF